MAKATNIPGKKVPQGKYSAFVPAPLPPTLDWTPRLIGLLSDADRLIGKLAGEGGRLPNPHVLMRPFTRREAVLSSKIEGTQATLGELLAAEAGMTLKVLRRRWHERRRRLKVCLTGNIKNYRPQIAQHLN